MAHSTAKNPAPTLHRAMLVREIVTLCPAAADIMAEYGMHCFSCALGGSETLEEGGRIHGFEDEVIDALLEDINEALATAPARPQTLTITQPAAQGIRSIAEGENKVGQGLAVIVDESGGFCMEFRPETEDGDFTFFNEAEPDVQIFASALTLSRIGGATIDMQDGRFKLDLPEEDKCCGGSESGCGCK